MLSKLSIRYEDQFNRVFEILPGFLLWMLITSPFWMAPSLSKIFGNLIITFAVYWLYRSVVFVVGLFFGYRRYRRDELRDWLSICNSLDFNTLHEQDTLPKSSKLPKHLVVIPIGGARYDTIKHTLEALDKQNYPKELIYMSLSFEQRLIDNDPEYFAEMKDHIRKDFAHFGDRLMIFDHPGNIIGESIGAAANRTWGNKKAIEFLESKGEIINDFLTTSPDEDIRFHKEYLANVSYKYLTAEKRRQKFFQTAVYLFSNNYWEVPSIIRAWSMSLSMPVLSSSVTHVHDRETWSCYTLNLQVMKDVNYWDTSIGIDDTPFYWRPFDYFNGDFTCETFFVPLYADAVYHPNKTENYKAQYKQLVRWGWGVVAFPIAMKVITQNHKIPIRKKIRKVYKMFEVAVLFKLAAIMFSLALPIIAIVNPDFNYSVDTYAFPQTLSNIMTIMAFMIIPSSIFKFLLIPDVPDSWSRWKFFGHFLLEIPLQIVILFTYAFLPFLVGPTRMMLGHSYGFLVTEKK